jgi:hypothetical protein
MGDLHAHGPLFNRKTWQDRKGAVDMCDLLMLVVMGSGQQQQPASCTLQLQ